MSYGTGIVFDDSSHWRNIMALTRLLELKAISDDTDGNFRNSNESLLMMLRLSLLVEAEPFPESLRIVEWILLRFETVFAWIVNRRNLIDDEIQPLRYAIEAASLPNLSVRVVSVHRCLGVLALTDAFQRGGVNRSIRTRGWGFPEWAPIVSKLFLRRSLLAYLDLMKEVVELSKAPRFERSKRLQVLKSQIAQWSPSFVDKAMVRDFVPANVDYALALVDEVDRIETRLLILKTVLAIERLRNATERLPQSLGELNPTFLEFVPLDPYDGKVLKYRKLSKGYSVYSVFENGRDDDGLDAFKLKDGIANGDIVFTVNR